MSKASIRDPQVLVRLRQKMVDFDGDARRALSSVQTSLSQVSEWLGREQQAYWRNQVRKREELVRIAKYELNRATRGPQTLMRKTGFDERKQLNRAKRSLEEAQAKLALVNRWSVALREKAMPMMTSCSQLRNLLDRNTPRALARLDGMLDSLDDYHRGESGEG